jgi:hypothetical protein
MPRRTPILLFVAILAAVLQSCSSIPAIEDRFSQATATTWRVAGDTMVFERTEARFSRSARDYVYLGPVAVNRRGSYEYLLWVGVGSTIDRGFLAPEAALPDVITLVVNDEPMQLTVADWSDYATGLESETPYDPPVTVQRHLVARVTRDQIVLFNSRGIDRLIVHTLDGNSLEFGRWGERIGWQAFVDTSPQ